MLYLNKLLSKIEENPALFKAQDIISILGLSSSQIKDLKKYALENSYIEQNKQEYNLTIKGKDYLKDNPLQSWATKEFPIRPEISLESLKLEKAPPTLTKAIRALAKYFLENQSLKEFSLDQALYEDLGHCKKLISMLEEDIFTGKRICLDKLYEKYLAKGLTKSLISIVLLKVLSTNIERIAIYEKFQFQLKFDCLMFDRICACPQNFEIQKTEMTDEYILKDVSKIILNKKSNNILEITKGLYATIKVLDKYTMNTSNLDNKTLRLRNVIVNAKDPISLFERDIPKVLSGKTLKEADREFLNNLKISLDELKECTQNLVKDLRKFLFEAFKSDSKEDLARRFWALKEYIAHQDMKVLLNTVIEIDVPDDLWINRIATFINKSRVPKDWTDEDYADFKVKTKELALLFMTLEATLGTSEKVVGEKYHKVLNSFLNLSKPEQMVLLRKVVNIK